jgi:hypothetical protein
MNILVGIFIFFFSFILGKIGKFLIIKKEYGIKEFYLPSFLLAFVLWEPVIMFVCYVFFLDFKRNKEKRIKELKVLNQFSSETRYELANIIFTPQYLYFMFEDNKDETTEKIYNAFLEIKHKRKNKRKTLIKRIEKEVNYRISHLNFKGA